MVVMRSPLRTVGGVAESCSAGSRVYDSCYSPGLLTKSSIPAAIHLSRSPNIACAVKAMIGILEYPSASSRARIIPVLSIPPTIGMETSIYQVPNGSETRPVR